MLAGVHEAEEDDQDVGEAHLSDRVGVVNGGLDPKVVRRNDGFRGLGDVRQDRAELTKDEGARPLPLGGSGRERAKELVAVAGVERPCVEELQLVRVKPGRKRASKSSGSNPFEMSSTRAFG